MEFADTWGQEVAEEYNKTAELFEKWEPSKNFTSIFNWLVLGHMKTFKSKSNVSVLDAGCGHGAWIEKLLQFCYRLGIKDVNLDGVDFAESRIKIARRRLHNFNNVNLYCADLLRFEPIRKYDLIYCLEVMQNIPETHHAYLLRKWAHSLTENGLLVIIDKDKFSTYSILRGIQLKMGKLRRIFGPFNLIPDQYLGVIEHRSYPSFQHLANKCRESSFSKVEVLVHKEFTGLVAGKGS